MSLILHDTHTHIHTHTHIRTHARIHIRWLALECARLVFDLISPTRRNGIGLSLSRTGNASATSCWSLDNVLGKSARKKSERDAPTSRDYGVAKWRPSSGPTRTDLPLSLQNEIPCACSLLAVRLAAFARAYRLRGSCLPEIADRRRPSCDERGEEGRSNVDCWVSTIVRKSVSIIVMSLQFIQTFKQNDRL